MTDLATKTNANTDLVIDEKHRIIKHIKNKRGNYVGTFVAIPINDKEVGVAWSKCHRLDLEKNRTNKISDRKKGLQIAMSRIINGTKVPVASTLKDQMVSFLNGITSYYRDKSIIMPIGIDAYKEELELKKVGH